MKLKIELLSVVVMKESTQTSTQTCTMVSEDISKSFLIGLSLEQFNMCN